MKIRKGFVSNSSSSSFVCEVCGDVESGWDLCLSDANMSRCENDHIFCNEHKNDVAEETIIKDILTNWKKYGNSIEDVREQIEVYGVDEFFEDGYYVSKLVCPICSMKIIKDYDLLKFILKEKKLDRKDMEELYRSKH